MNDSCTVQIGISGQYVLIRVGDVADQFLTPEEARNAASEIEANPETFKEFTEVLANSLRGAADLIESSLFGLGTTTGSSEDGKKS